jgi:rhodopsin domain-containing protein
MLLAMECFYIATVGLFKISLGLFLARILITHWQRLILFWILGVFSIYTLGYFFFAVFQCGVPSGNSFWTRKLARQCASDSIGISLGYLHASLSAGSDITLVVLPIIALKNSLIKRGEKIVISCILGIGAM